jgi:hypothetical protein
VPPLAQWQQPASSNSAHDIGQVSSGNLTVDFNRATTQLSLGITGFSQASTLQSLDISGSGSLTSASNAFSFNDMGVSALIKAHWFVLL